MTLNSRLAVCSVFSGNYNTAFWLKCQMEGLKKSVTNFDHLVYLNQADESLFSESIVVGKSDIAPLQRYRWDGFHFSTGMAGHIRGLRKLLSYCELSDYECFLILDSDCFPVHEQWMDILVDNMSRFGKSFAAPARVENLDVFPHPCAFFTADPHFLRFAGEWNENLLGWITRDIICAGHPNEWFPLLKTNRCSKHPLLATIYYDVFYHHGAGSREFNMRSLCYYDPILGRYPDADTILAELKHDPQSFIASIR